MSSPLTETTNGYLCSDHIYVASDGKTVVDSTDPRVAFLKHAKGSTIRKSERDALVFFVVASKPVSEPIPDSEVRQATETPDNRPRRGRPPKFG